MDREVTWLGRFKAVFVADVAVEVLDALPPEVLRERLVENVEATLNLDQLRAGQQAQEEQEWCRIQKALGRIR